MNNTVNVADCCRACLRIDCTLTSTDIQDSDSIKLFDKLLACVSEVVSKSSTIFCYMSDMYHLQK